MTASTFTFWHNKRVLVTGHSGFKGSWLTLWLNQLGAHVTGLSLLPQTKPALFDVAKIAELCDSHFVDIRNAKACAEVVELCQPEIVIHLAAQALVRTSYQDPLETYATNIMGTANILEAIRLQNSVKVALMVTTDKVYSNREWYWAYREVDTLGGHDPYSASKAACEIVIQSYRDAFFSQQNIALASVRAGNVIGGGDWSENRLIPDAIRAWQSHECLHIRNPSAVRPWQHVLDPLSGYLSLAQQLWHQANLAGSYNLGPEPSGAISVRNVITQAMKLYPNSMTQFGEVEAGPHEAGLLNLDISKAKSLLGVTPRWQLAQAIEKTINWYQHFHSGHDARQLCLEDILSFEASQ
ncbi:CDP-glucose 4,6-dehydratase [Shewanella putrefaciens]|nr:CDP-glucose 4,6-dehydratase [Shewanella putrefaciens]